MANVVKIKNSNISGRKPTSLLEGELAINREDGKLFYLDSITNSIQSFTANPVQISALIYNYNRSNVNDLKDQQIGFYKGVSPPYKHNHRYYAETTYSPTSNTSINNTNIAGIEKLNVGEYQISFISNFSNNTYNVELNVQKFDDFGESVNYGIVTDKQIDSVTVKTGRTNISDVNTIDRYDISEFTIKLFS